MLPLADRRDVAFLPHRCNFGKRLRAQRAQTSLRFECGEDQTVSAHLLYSVTIFAHDFVCSFSLLPVVERSLSSLETFFPESFCKRVSVSWAT